MTQDKKFTGLTSDSRAVDKGFLFAALKGHTHDGRAFIVEALQKGASAILTHIGTPKPDTQAMWMEEENPRLRFAHEAAKFYAGQPAHMIAVTGTNGKTSTVNFTRIIWEYLGVHAASIGTLGVIGQGISGYDGMTTPDPVKLHQVLQSIAQHGVTHAAMEASSIGLDQYRLDGAHIHVAAFTNLTQDHLDYHGDMEAYRDAKARLFSDVVEENGTVILNADDPASSYYEDITRKRGLRVWTYGKAGHDVCIRARAPDARGQRLTLSVFGKEYNMYIPLVGEFQAMNVLCAAACVMAGGVSFEKISPILEKLPVISGRMQRVDDPQGVRTSYIDYAHTPDALENILKALRPHTQKRLICVFGCGGDRDRTKRPLMGAIAARLADIAIVTDDNPRSEDPAAIRAEILREAGDSVLNIGGRRAAIAHAVSLCTQGDILVIAGKGHEHGQIFKDHTEPFDDAAELAAAMKGAL